MLRRVWFAGVLAAAALALLVAPGLAKGPPQKVTIEGPGLAVPIEITDPATLESLGMTMLEDVDSKISGPGTLSAVYLVTRYYQDGARYIPFDQVLYARQAESDRPLVYYVGIVNGWSEFDGRWFNATADGAAAMESVLGKAVVAASAEAESAPAPAEQPAEPAAIASVQPKSAPSPLSVALLGATLAGGFAAGWLLRPRVPRAANLRRA